MILTLLRRASSLALIAAALSAGACAAPSLRLPNPLKGRAATEIAPPKVAEQAPTPARAPVDTRPPNSWAQEGTDVPPDPAIRFGRLPNGMRYALLRNGTPTGQASLRLRFDVGSLDEAEDQRGLAHFLEHMAFNGSKAVPEGEMVKILERHGLAFGADTNASTDFSETVYKLDLPRTDDETVNTSLMLLREQASNLLIDPAAVDRERGVVLSEERGSDTPALRVYRARLAFALKGQLAPTRFPIGERAVLETAPAARIQDLYRRFYRPERAVLVAVGDFDPDAMEARIKARFGDWTGQGPAGAAPALGPLAQRGAEARVLVEPGAPLSLQLMWVSPPDLSPDSRAKRGRGWIEALGLSVLNRRLQRIARGETPPFISAGAGRGDELNSAEITTLYISARPEDWRTALAAAEQEARRIVQHGVRQDELDREIQEYRTTLTARVAGAATRRTPALANEIVGTLEDREVETSPQQDLELFETTVAALKAQAVDVALREVFAGQGPLAFMATPQPVEGGDAALLVAVSASRAVAVAAPAGSEAKPWPYLAFGAPSPVAEEREVADLDTAMLRFGNGVRLTVKPTRFRDDQILVTVRIGRGRLDLPVDRETPLWASGAFTSGGLGKLTVDELQQTTAANVVSTGFGVGDDSYLLSGATRPEDLALQMQMLAAYATDAAWRPQAFRRVQASAGTLHEQLAATPGGVLSRDLPALLHSGDARWAFPSQADIAGARPEDLKAIVSPELAEGEIEVTVVGHTTVEAATDAVARTFGALPPRKAPAASATAPAPGAATRFPAPTPQPVTRTHKGRADQAVAFVAWPAPDLREDPQRGRVLRLLSEIIQLRLTEEVREKQGAAYSPGADYAASLVFPGYGYLSASVETPPDKIAGFFAAVDSIAADLAARPVDADELDRARKPRLDALEKSRQTNEYWLGQLSGAQTDPVRLELIRASIPGLQRVTPADIQRAAAAYLQPGKAFRMQVTAEKK